MRRYAAITALCLAGIAAQARSAHGPSLADEYSHRIWSVKDGLPQSTIQAITQTPDGYLWIGTPGGLARFDGAHFSVFDRSNTPALREDSILTLCPSKDGSLWIGTDGGGLLRFRGGSFQTIGLRDGLTNGFVRSLYEDRSGTLWVGTDRGFFRFQGARLERMDGRNGIPVTAITGIREERDGKIWASGGIGLLVAERGVLRHYQPANGAFANVRSLRETHAGGFWVSTLTRLFRLENGLVVRQPALDRIRALALEEDSDGNLWVGTLGKGLIRVGAAGVVAFREPGVLPDNTIWAIFEDRERNIWIGTQDGLLRLSKTAVHSLTGKDGLADDNVTTVYEDRPGNLWFTTITGLVYRLTGKQLAPFRLPGPAAGVRARAVFVDREGALWIATSGAGVVRVRAGKVTTFTTKDGLRDNIARQFLQDRRGDLWIALASGLSRWDGRRFRNYYIEDGLSYGSVRMLVEDQAGDILIGTDRGLNRLRDGKFVRDPLFAQLDGEKVWAIHEDADRELWIGTRGGGLFRIKAGRLSKLTVRDGLLSDSIYQLLEDGNGNLWMSSPAGVFSARLAELNRRADGRPGPVAIVPYGTAEGLESPQMNGGQGTAGCRTASGYLWFPSVKGPVRIDPNQRRMARPSPVLIESLTADDTPIPLSGEIRIRPGHGKLEIGYTACNLLSPGRITFQYMLEGFDERWTAAAAHRSAYYTNLPPGNYRFRVVATSSNEPRQTSEAWVAFVWQPHVYQTGWFYALCAGLLAACVWAALRLYARQTKARYALLLAERTRLAREMHDTVIQGCVGISTLLEAVSGLRRIDADRMRDLLSQARVQIRLTLDEARQAVWDLRNAPMDGGLTGTLRDVARQLSLEKGIASEVEISGTPVGLGDRRERNILLIAKEAIRNAVTHAHPRQIRVHLGFEAGEVRLEVIDDGLGFIPACDALERNGHFGIVGMRERVEQLGGTFSLRSSPGQGTAVIARLPLAMVRRKRETSKVTYL